jgi:putative membrane protein
MEWTPPVGIGWWMAFGAVWMVLFWGAIIALIVWGIRALTGRSARPVAEESAIEIARRRYTRGEITKEEFEEIKATLSRG